MKRWSIVLAALLCAATGCAERPQDRPPVAAATARAAETRSGTETVPSAATGEAVMVTTGTDSTPVALTSDKGEAPSPEPAAPKETSLSAPIEFTVVATVMGFDTVRLRSDDISAVKGLAVVDREGRGGRPANSLSIERFAHFGVCDSPYIFRWVLYMPKPGELAYEPGRATGGAQNVTLQGELYFDVILKSATKPIKTRSRVVPVFRGTARSWPARDLTLTLVNGPIKFYKEDRMHDSAAGAMLKVIEAKYVIRGKWEGTSFFAKSPQITRVTASGSKGARIEWSSTADAVKPASISGYNIYRSTAPNDPGSWKLVASVPSTQTSVADEEGHGRVYYAVVHRMDHPTGYQIEGLFSTPVLLAPAP